MSRLPSLIAGALVLAAATAPLAVAADNNQAVARRACTNMGLNPTEAPFTACVASLLQSMSGTVAEARVEPAQTAQSRATISGR